MNLVVVVGGMTQLSLLTVTCEPRPQASHAKTSGNAFQGKGISTDVVRQEHD